MGIRYLTVEEILGFHALEVGDDVGLRDRNLLEAAAERPRRSAFGDDAYPDLASKAGALLDLVRNHPFVDGNKRIGVLASFVFIELNGHEVDAENDEVIGLCVDIPSYGTKGDRFERIGTPTRRSISASTCVEGGLLRAPANLKNCCNSCRRGDLNPHAR